MTDMKPYAIAIAVFLPEKGREKPAIESMLIFREAPSQDLARAVGLLHAQAQSPGGQYVVTAGDMSALVEKKEE